MSNGGLPGPPLLLRSAGVRGPGAGGQGAFRILWELLPAMPRGPVRGTHRGSSITHTWTRPWAGSWPACRLLMLCVFSERIQMSVCPESQFHLSSCWPAYKLPHAFSRPRSPPPGGFRAQSHGHLGRRG